MNDTFVNVSRRRSTFAPVVDPTRQGSPAAHALTGLVAIVLAATLVMGQVALATTKGIATHLEQTSSNLERGNRTVDSVVARSRPAAEVQRLVRRQATTLGSTRQSLVLLNGTLSETARTTSRLDRSVAGTQASSVALAQDLQKVRSSSRSLGTGLRMLPTTARAVRTAVEGTRRDTEVIAWEIARTGIVLRNYGLPRAQGARRS